MNKNYIYIYICIHKQIYLAPIKVLVYSNILYLSKAKTTVALLEHMREMLETGKKT